jgi:hypothetical protein
LALLCLFLLGFDSFYLNIFCSCPRPWSCHLLVF